VLRLRFFLQQLAHASSAWWVAARGAALALCTVLALHAAACLWFAGMRAAHVDGGWARAEQPCDDRWALATAAPPHVRYLCGVHWALQTIVPLGYGDVPAQTAAQRWLTAAALPAGLLLLVGTVQAPPPPPPSRTNWTRLVSPPVLTGHVSSRPRRASSRRVATRAAPLPGGSSASRSTSGSAGPRAGCAWYSPLVLSGHAASLTPY